jgi:hypothetical protein
MMARHLSIWDYDRRGIISTKDDGVFYGPLLAIEWASLGD